MRAPPTTTTSRLLAGDEVAFTLVYRWLQPRLVRYLTVLVGPMAEDVSAETWANVCRDLGRFEGGVGAFTAWTTRIARNRAMDHLRAERRRPVSLVPAWELPEPGVERSSEEVALDSSGTREALAMIAGLPPDQADAVLLRVVIGLDARATGEVLGKRAGAVRTAAYRGLRTLAARLEEHGV